MCLSVLHITRENTIVIHQNFKSEKGSDVMNELDIRKKTKLDNAFMLADNIVTKNYLSLLDSFSPVAPPEELIKSDVCKYASLFNIKRIVYDRDENTLQKLVNTYASSVGYGSGLVMIIRIPKTLCWITARYRHFLIR